MFYVYVLLNSRTRKRYVGYTGDLKGRLRRHNSDHHGYTGQRGEWALIYSEAFDTKIAAIKREKFLKSGKGREFLNSLAE